MNKWLQRGDKSVLTAGRPEILHTGPLHYRAELNEQIYKETLNVYFLCLTVFWGERGETLPWFLWFICGIWQKHAEKRQKLILQTVHFTWNLINQKRVCTIFVGGGVEVWFFFWVQCDISLWLVYGCSTVFIHAVCKCTEFSWLDGCSPGPSYSHVVVEEELVNYLWKWEELGQKTCGQSWWRGGRGIGSVWGRGSSTKMEGQMSRLSRRWRWGESHWPKWHRIQSLCVFRKLTPAPPPIHGATSPTCRRRLQTLMVILGEYCRETGEPSERSQFRRGALQIWPSDSHFHSGKGLESFPPSLHPLWESQAGYSCWGYQVSSGGEKEGTKVTSRNRPPNSHPADFPDLGEAVHIAWPWDTEKMQNKAHFCWMNQHWDETQRACTLGSVPNDPLMWWGSIPAIPPNGPSPPAPMGNWSGCTKAQYKKAEQLFLTTAGAIIHTSTWTHTHTKDADDETDKVPHIWSTSAWRYRVYHGVHVVARVGWIWHEQVWDDNKV